jgi:multidrug efflux pump subunit AcrA (membrane-fusion protein)
MSEISKVEQKSSPAAIRAGAVNSDIIHKKPQKSVTLNRKYAGKSKAQIQAEKTAAQKAAYAQFKRRHELAQARNQARQAQLLGAKHGVVLKPLPDGDIIQVNQPAQAKADSAPPHPVATKANQKLHPQTVLKRHMTATEMKRRDIREAFERIAADDQVDSKQAKKATSFFRSKRLAGAVSTFAAILLLAGYLVYLNMPTISVKIAAIQSGVDVTYPSYKPIGYSLRGLASAQNDRVAMEFSNDSNSFTITQQKSSWDSSAVYSNYVQREWGDSYSVNKERGLTIYANGGKAVWVNGGVFYIIDGPSSLSGQIEKIAISL